MGNVDVVRSAAKWKEKRDLKIDNFRRRVSSSVKFFASVSEIFCIQFIEILKSDDKWTTLGDVQFAISKRTLQIYSETLIWNMIEKCFKSFANSGH